MGNIPPLITLVVPSLNQGNYLDAALQSIFDQGVPVEVFVMDGGSHDNSIHVIRKWESWLSGWRTYPDTGQSSAINEGMEMGTAPFVCWLNSDDYFLPNGLKHLLSALIDQPQLPAVYGRSLNLTQSSGKFHPVWVEPFDVKRLALRCIISQPATLIRRSVWNTVGGLDCSLGFAMDYDLWWRIYNQFGPMQFTDCIVAVNRDHFSTKTRTYRFEHYKEAMSVVRQHYGSVPLKWWLIQPYSVWLKSLLRFL